MHDATWLAALLDDPSLGCIGGQILQVVESRQGNHAVGEIAARRLTQFFIGRRVVQYIIRDLKGQTYRGIASQRQGLFRAPPTVGRAAFGGEHKRLADLAAIRA